MDLDLLIPLFIGAAVISCAFLFSALKMHLGRQTYPATMVAAYFALSALSAFGTLFVMVTLIGLMMHA